MKKTNGIFTISLDFELFWGVRDKRTIESYRENLEGTEKAISNILESFDKYEIHATWAVVGFLLADDTHELSKYFPRLKPQYKNNELSPYDYLSNYKNKDKKCHFSLSSLEKIINSNNQELATHTFSHYYCLEDGQTSNEFQSDLSAFKKIAKEKYNKNINSIVFPRNQFNINYLQVLKEIGISSYRGTENNWAYKGASNEEATDLSKRAFRLLDNYINLTGFNTYALENIKQSFPYNIPSSRFLRPYSNKFKLLDFLRLIRIKSAMTHAAKKGEVFHLWWHPHNFGINTTQNIEFLEKILKHYKFLEKKYDMKSQNMYEISQLLKEKI